MCRTCFFTTQIKFPFVDKAIGNCKKVLQFCLFSVENLLVITCVLFPLKIGNECILFPKTGESIECSNEGTHSPTTTVLPKSSRSDSTARTSVSSSLSLKDADASVRKRGKATTKRGGSNADTATSEYVKKIAEEVGLVRKRLPLFVSLSLAFNS